jgi:GxxExxY protein
MSKFSSQFYYPELSYCIQGCVFKVFNTLGSGHKEQVYQKSLEREMQIQKLPFEKEKTLNVKYEDVSVGQYRPDFVVDNNIILELKAVSYVPKVFETQLIHYLKTTDYKIGFLINFGANKLYMRRFVWSGKYLRKSA